MVYLHIENFSKKIAIKKFNKIIKKKKEIMKDIIAFKNYIHITLIKDE